MDNIVPYDCKMSVEQFIRFHILVYSYMEGIHLTPTSIHALTLLGIRGRMQLSDYCRELVDKRIYLSRGSAVNAVSWLYKTGILTKEGNHRKTVMLCDKMKDSNNRESVLLIKCIHAA